MAKAHIFISYAHEDKEWVLEGPGNIHLIPRIRRHTSPDAEIWFDEGLVIGEKWDEEIHNHIIQSHIAILLISESFVSSDYIVNKELIWIKEQVEKNDMKTLNPMNMEEFMLALGEDDLVEQIKKCFQTDTPLPSALHDAAMQLYRQYLVVGGMPECVMQFAETKDYILVRHTQATILASYLNDMSKYNNLNEIKKTRLAYDNITVQLSKKNTRFQYKLIKKGGRASEFENAIEWLCLSGIVSQVYKVEQIKKPLENYRDIDAFKIYVSDLGLLCAKKDLAANDILYMVEEINDFKGGMAENYVNVQLSINGYHTYYWESERGAEIDFIIQRDGQLIPIEVKSADNTRAKSLKVYMDTYKPAYAIKLSAKNFGFEDNKKTVPLYAAFCI